MRHASAFVPLSLSAASLLACVTAPAAAESAPPAPKPIDQVFSVTVSENEKLQEAIDQATKALKSLEYSSATIKLSGCTTQTLSKTIELPGSLTIIGDKDRSYGPGTNFDTPCTTVTTDGDYGVTVDSPLTVQGLKFKAKRQLFNIHQSIIVKNSTFIPFYTNDPFTYVPIAVKTEDYFKNKSGNIVIQDSRFINTTLIGASFPKKNVNIFNNDIQFRGNTYATAIDVQDDSFPPGTAAIHDNRIQIANANGFTSVIYINHTNIAVHNNNISSGSTSDYVEAIKFENPKHKVTRFNITQNNVIGLNALRYSGGYPKEARHITINNNNFSRALGAFRKSSWFPESIPDDINDRIDATKNFWGTLDLSNVLADTRNALPSYSPIYGPLAPFPDQIGAPAPLPTLSTNPAPPPAEHPQRPGHIQRLAGASRFETAIQISQKAYPERAKAVVLARADGFADSVTAVPFADAAEAPILLSPSNRLHPATAAEIQRVLTPGSTVYVMGGEAALSNDVVMAVARLGMRVERIAGPHRAATAVEVAKRLQGAGKAKEVLLVDGGAWEPGLVAGPAAAEADGVVLMTLSGQVTPETHSFLHTNTNMTITGIGHKPNGLNRVSNVLAGDSPEALSTAVAKEFFVKPNAVGLATTADFADALAGGPHMAKLHGPILLTSEVRQQQTRDYLKGLGGINTAFIYGGPARLSDQFTTQLITP